MEFKNWNRLERAGGFFQHQTIDEIKKIKESFKILFANENELSKFAYSYCLEYAEVI